MSRGRVIAIGGPTAAGKSALALALASSLGGEIVSADSVQVYRGFDIGSAKPSPEERAAVPHHLVDICAPEETYSAARFAADADAAIAGILQRGRTPIVVGGTGLYLRALLTGLFDAPSDPAVRAALRRRAEEGDAAALHAELTALDPEAAAPLAVADTVRVVRALEVCLVSGERVSALRAAHAETPRYDALRLTVSRRRASLDARIAARAARMVANGLVEEASALAAAYPNAPALGSLGYKQAVDVSSGRLSSGRLAEEVYIQTRRFAKRQLTWFRGQWSSYWFDLDTGSDAASEAAERWWNTGVRPADAPESDDGFRI